MTIQKDTLAEIASAAIRDFASAEKLEDFKCDFEIAEAPHKPSGLPPGKQGIYCFFRDGQALKIGKAGPNSGPRFRYQPYNPNSANSTFAGSLLKHPNKIGIAAIPDSSIGDWITTNTSRINFLIPASYGRATLSRFEAFLHDRWPPIYEGRVIDDEAA